MTPKGPNATGQRRKRAVARYENDKTNNWLVWRVTTFVGNSRQRFKKKHGSYDGLPRRRDQIAATVAWLREQPMICRYCGHDVFEATTFGLDHAQPIARDGGYQTDNLRVCCRHCNSAKGNMSEAEFKGLIELFETWEDKGKTVLIRLRMGVFRGGGWKPTQ